MFKRSMPFLLCLGALGVFGSPAYAETEGVGWDVQAHTFPTNLAPGGRGAIEVRIVNVGAANSKGTVTVTDTLPPGVVARGAGSFIGLITFVARNVFEENPLWDCAGNGPGGTVAGARVVTCTNDSANALHIVGGGGLPTRGPLFEGENPALGLTAGDPELGIAVEVPAGTPEGTRDGTEANRVTVAGGGAVGTASVNEPVVISSTSPPFGFAGADTWFSNADGTFDTQAGSHPYEASFSFDFNNVEDSEHNLGVLAGGREPRNLRFRLPPGFIGNPSTVPQCPLSLFVTNTGCPADTQVGIVAPGILKDGVLDSNRPDAVWNLVPSPGEPAEFGFVLDGNLTVVGTEVRSGSDYGITSTVNNISRTEVVNSVLTLWGEPSAPSHTRWRCKDNLDHTHYECGVPSVPTHRPFLTLPTSCSRPQEFGLSVNSWEAPDEVARTSFVSHDSNGVPVGFTGCEDLAFGPTISTSPDTSNADTPAGLSVEVKPPVGGLEDTEGVSTADVKSTTVALPEGVVINPGQAAGLSACQPSQTGLEPLPDGEEDNGPPECPLSSKVGEDEIETPLLKHSLKGDVYIVQSNPPDLKLLVAASGEGVNLKLVGEVHLTNRRASSSPRSRYARAAVHRPPLVVHRWCAGGARDADAVRARMARAGICRRLHAMGEPVRRRRILRRRRSRSNMAPAVRRARLAAAVHAVADFGLDDRPGRRVHRFLAAAAGAGDDQQRIEKLQFKVP